MYFADALSYGFNGRWLRRGLLIAFLTFVPLVNIIGAVVMAGYSLRVIRSIFTTGETPDFDVIGDDFTRGVLVALFNLIFVVPAIVIFGLLLAPYYVVLPNGRAILSSPNVIALVLAIAVILIANLLSVLGTVRFALTGNWQAYFAVRLHLKMLIRRPGASFAYLINAFFAWLGGTFLVFIGLLFFIVPGILMASSLVIAPYYLQARFAIDLGYDEKLKHKTIGIAY